MTGRRLIRATIRGEVQGVGFRAFVERRAIERGVDGWVRNRENGSVEVMFAGAAPAVESLIAACREGPAGARVSDVEIGEAEDAAGVIPSSRPAGFFILPTV